MFLSCCPSFPHTRLPSTRPALACAPQELSHPFPSCPTITSTLQNPSNDRCAGRREGEGGGRKRCAGSTPRGVFVPQLLAMAVVHRRRVPVAEWHFLLSTRPPSGVLCRLPQPTVGETRRTARRALEPAPACKEGEGGGEARRVNGGGGDHEHSTRIKERTCPNAQPARTCPRTRGTRPAARPRPRRRACRARRTRRRARSRSPCTRGTCAVSRGRPPPPRAPAPARPPRAARARGAKGSWPPPTLSPMTSYRRHRRLLTMLW